MARGWPVVGGEAVGRSSSGMCAVGSALYTLTGRARVVYCAGLESDRSSAGQWGQRWHAALVGFAAWGVRAGAKGASGGGPVAQGEPGWPAGWPVAGMTVLINVWELESGEHLQHAAAGPALRAPQYHWDQGIDRGAAGHAASVGSD